MKPLHTLRIVAAVLAMFVFCGSVFANIGTVQFSAGDVKLRDKAGVVRDVKKGDTLNEGDTVLTGNGASAQLKMSDGGILAVRPQTELRIDQYKYSGKEDGTENAFMSLVKGGFRTITGIIGRSNKDNYKIGTTTATIGIRGTDHEPFFIPPVPAGAPQPPTPPGTYDKVNVGTAFIATPQGSINIAPNQVGFAAPNQAPQLLPVMPDIFKATPPVNQAQQQKEAEKEKQAAAEKEKQAAAPKPAAKPAAGAGGAGGQSQEAQGTPAAEKTADTPAPAVAAAPSEVRSTAIVDNTSTPLTTTATTVSTSTSATGNPAAPTTITQEVTGSNDSGSLEVNLTDQTVSTSAGTTAPISQGAYASQAQAAADEAQFDANLAVDAHTQALTFETQTNTAVAAIGVIAPVSVAPATAAITTAGSNITTAQSAVTAAAALTPVDLTAATSAITSATTNFNTQQTALTALGSVADLTAASSAVATANTVVGSATTAVGALPATPASLTAANTAITNANTAVSTASTAVTTVNALAAPNTALAATNATTSTAARTTAEAQAAQAAAAIAANGAFADATYAVPANTATQSALTQVQGGDALVQGAASTATTQTTAFNTAKANANTALGSANTSVGLANTTLATATTENTNFSNAKAAATTALGNATTSVGQANTALTDATNFNVTFATNQTAAQSSMTTASGDLATANTQLTSAQAANAALTTAIAAAQAALINANAALAAANAQLATANNSNTAIATAQSAVTGLSAQAAAGVAAAQTAAGLAQVAATASQVAATDALVKQNAGDFAGAQAALGVALARLGDAQVQLTAAQTAQAQSQTAATTANTQLTAAQSAVTAATTAVTAAVTAAGNASTLAATATTQASAATAQQAAATTAAGNATTAAGSAQSNVSSAQTSIGAAGSAKTSAQTSAGNAQTLAGTAQTQAGTAQTQATAASTAYSAATTAASSAQTQANTAGTQAGTAQTEAGAATTAQGAAVAAVSTTTTELGNTQTAATAVAANYQKAQYNNPAVASSNFVHVALGSKAVAGGFERIEAGNDMTNANTVYVLDGNKNLVEIRNTNYEREGWNYFAASGIGANAKFSGGTPANTFNVVDANGAFYMGRWAGGLVDITGPLTVTDILGPASMHWLVGLTPGNAVAPYPISASSPATLSGTANYTLLAATSPTDSLGNTGVLSSATLSANFSAQTVTTQLGINFSGARDSAFTMLAANVPIDPYGFEAATGMSYAPSINCVGVNCAASYAGRIGGVFGGTAAGGTGNRVGVGYGITPNLGTPPPSTPLNDYISGVAVLTTSDALTPGVLSNFNGSTNVRNEVRYLTKAVGTNDIYNVNIRDNVSGLITNTGFTYNGPVASNNMMFDAAGNLVRIFETGYVVFDRATDVAATSTAFNVPTPLANAQVSFGAAGSVAAEHYEYTPTGYTDPIIRLGRWQGGAINVMDTLTGEAYLDPIFGGAHWLVRQGVPSFAGITGTHNYSRVAANSPTDNYGNVGTLEGARLSVDFDRMLVSLGLRVSMPGFGGSLLAARADQVPINSGGFNVSSGTDPATNPAYPNLLAVSCTGPGCALNQTYGGRVRGAFAGEQAAGTPGFIEGAFYRYTFNTTYPDATTAAANGRVYEEYVDGYAAFGRDPSNPTAPVGSTYVTPRSNPAQFSVNGPSPNPPGDAVALSAYTFFNGSFNEMRSYSYDAPGSATLWGPSPPISSPGYAIDGSGNPTFISSVFEDDNLNIAGGTGAVSASAQGIAHGYILQSVVPTLTLSGQDFNGPFAGRQPLDALHWLRGPALFPWYAGSAMVAAVDGSNATVPVGYAQLGGYVTNQNGIAGSVTGTLHVNFNAQTVNTAINTSVLGNTFTATANGVSLDDGAFFWASTGGAYRHNFALTSSVGPSNFGTINGALMNTTAPAPASGDGILGGAGVAFTFKSGPTVSATGTLVFGNPAYTTTPADGSTFKPSVLMDYRMMLLAQGMNMGDPTNSVPQPGAVTRDGTGATPLVSEWDNYQVQFSTLSSDRTQFVNSSSAAPANPQGALVKFDGRETMIFNSCTPPTVCNSETGLPVRYAFADKTGGGPAPGTAVALETGYDPTTGMRWGRWGNGVVNVGDRGSPNGATAPPAGTAPASINLTAQNWHYLITASQGGPVTIPTTGTANYLLVGGTSPTAFTPGQAVADVGTLGAVTLNVDFLNQKITNLAINASTPGSGSWQATASNLPIVQKSIFFAEKTLAGGGDLTVTRNGLPTNTAGQVVGGFTNGAVAAGMAYSLNQGGPTGVTVSGVAVMKK